MWVSARVSPGPAGPAESPSSSPALGTGLRKLGVGGGFWDLSAVLDELTPFSMMEPERGPTRRAVTAAPAPGEALGSRRRSGFGPPLCPWRPAAPLASPLPRPGCCVGSEMATYSRFPPGGQEKPGPTSDPPRVFRPLVVPAPWDRPPGRLLLLFSILPASSYIAGY